MRDKEYGLYWYCFSCRRAFDTIELIAAVKFNNNIELTIDEILRNPDFILPREISLKQIRDEYNNNYKLKKNLDAWEYDAGQKWLKGEAGYINLASQIGVSVQISESYDKLHAQIARWLRATTRDDIRRRVNSGLQPDIPRDDFYTCLAIPWQRIPGITSAFLIIGAHKKSKLWIPEPINVNNDPGVMLLDALPNEPKRVLAVNSPYLALWLQYKAMQENLDPVCVVAWHEDTDPSVWEQIGAQEIVFWSYTPTAGLFKQALNARCKTYISYLEKPPFDVFYFDKSIESYTTWDKFRNILDKPTPSHIRLNEFFNRLHDPYNAACEYMLSHTPEELTHILSVVKPSVETVEQIINRCTTDSAKKLLEERIRAHQCAQSHTMMGGSVVQYIGPIEANWILRRRGYEELISEAVLQLESCIVDADVGTRTYYGIIHYKGRRYPFVTDSKKLRYETAELITDTVEMAGGGLPFVSHRFKGALYDIVLRFSNIEKTHFAITKVGWTKTRHAFVLPNQTIADGKIINSSSLRVSDRPIPCNNLEIPELDIAILESWVEPTEANATIWAFVAAICNNVELRRVQLPTKGIGFIGQLAEKAAWKIASDLRLITVALGDTPDEIRNYEQQQRNHDLPVFTVTKDNTKMLGPSVFTWMVSPGEKNNIVQVNGDYAASIVLSGGWMLIDARSEPTGQFAVNNVAMLIFNYLANRQSRNIDVPSDQTVFNVLSDIKSWVSQVLNKDVSYVFNTAKLMLNDCAMYNDGTQLLYMIAQLLHDGHLLRDYGDDISSSPNAPAVIIDVENNRVFVSKRKLVNAINRIGLPPLDVPLATSMLNNCNALLGETGLDRSAWVIDYGIWLSAVNRWLVTQEKSLLNAQEN